LPANSVDRVVLDDVRRQVIALAQELGVIGLMNVQFAIPRSEYGVTGVSPVRAGEGTHPYASSGDAHVGGDALVRPTNGTGGKVYVLEVNPRASRTVPYVSKATGIPMAKIASRLMTGRKLREFLPEYIEQQKDLDTGSFYYVKSPVFPWNKFPGVDTVLGPEMKSTGEVMGVADNFGEAFAKAQLAAGQKLPTQGCVFISVTDHDKPQVAEVARKFVDMGFKLVATAGTGDVIEEAGMLCERVYKVKEGRPNVVDLIKGDRIQLIVNTPEGADPFFDEKAIRRAAVTARIPTITTLAAARAAAEGIAALQRGEVNVKALQQLHAERLVKQRV
jgi:carbamoyl-phosphate synthase large subunit